jgi:hypothetical protein
MERRGGGRKRKKKPELYRLEGASQLRSESYHLAWMEGNVYTIRVLLLRV